jgi:predicted transcriptional regulator
VFRNVTSESFLQPKRQPDPGAAARRRAANAGSPGAADGDTLAALEADLAGEPGPGTEERGEPGPGTEERGAPRSAGDSDQLKLTDPKAMRALAHPVRMSLLELLEGTGTLTATQASELLGESPANCAFHLRTLAKYGFLREAGGGRGRERPWKRAYTQIQVTSEQEDPRATVTAGMLQRVWLDRVLERARERLSSTDGLPTAWKHTQEASQTVQFLTPEETKELAGEVLEVLRRYEDRRDDPSRRPDDALPVEFLFFGYPLTDLAGIAEQARQHDEKGRPPRKDGPAS